MGTIAAIAPIGVGIAHASDIPLAICMGAIVGGAMFGDNLSVISDTSIAATQIHGCSAIDKFKSNIVIALPAMFLTVCILAIIGSGQESASIPARIISCFYVCPIWLF
jgi:Na+/H+ antiporter NhaC